jgi:exocyst complex component 7
MLLKASQTLSPGVGALKKSGANDTLVAEDFANDSDQELEKYLVLLLGLQRLLVLEKNIINDIVPNSRHGEVFSRLAQNSIDLVIKDADNITQRVLRSISRKEWSAAMGIFSALRHVQILQPDIDRTCDATQKQQLSGVLNRLSQTGAKALEQFIDMVKGDSGGGMVMSTSTLSYSTNPKDATVHELTSNTIWFLEHLQEHCDIIGGILLNEQPYSSALEGIGTHKQMSVEQKNKALLGIYTSKFLIFY